MDHKRQTFKVLRITNNIDEYSDCKEDTEMYPLLIEHVEDEMDIFVYCLETGDFWKCSDFFYQVSVKYFNTPNGI